MIFPGGKGLEGELFCNLDYYLWKSCSQRKLINSSSEKLEIPEIEFSDKTNVSHIQKCMQS